MDRTKVHVLPLEGRYELGWVDAEDVLPGDLLIKGDNLTRRVVRVLPVYLGYHRFEVSRPNGDAVLGTWQVKVGGGVLVLRDVTPPPPAEMTSDEALGELRHRLS